MQRSQQTGPRIGFAQHPHKRCHQSDEWHCARKADDGNEPARGIGRRNQVVVRQWIEHTGDAHSKGLPETKSNKTEDSAAESSLALHQVTPRHKALVLGHEDIERHVLRHRPGDTAQRLRLHTPQKWPASMAAAFRGKRDP